MLFYLISLGFFIYVFMSSFGIKTKKATILNISSCVLAVSLIYYIFSEELTDSFILNFLLSLLPALGGLISLFSFYTTASEKSTEKVVRKGTPVFNVKIVDNEITAASYPSQAHNPTTTTYPSHNTAPVAPAPPYAQTPNPYAQTVETSQETQTQYQPICYKNVKIAGYDSCDVEEAPGFIRIKLTQNNKEYEFYVNNRNIVAYRWPGMSEPENYYYIEG